MKIDLRRKNRKILLNLRKILNSPKKLRILDFFVNYRKQAIFFKDFLGIFIFMELYFS